MVSADIAIKESPFTPGKPVPVDYFMARHEEIERLERTIRQTASGRNENVFITFIIYIYGMKRKIKKDK